MFELCSLSLLLCRKGPDITLTCLSWPDDWPVLCDWAALVCAHHTAKILLNVVFCCLYAERMRCGYHLDMLVVGLTTGLCSGLGLP
jgi:hypothetical protein